MATESGGRIDAEEPDDAESTGPETRGEGAGGTASGPEPLAFVATRPVAITMLMIALGGLRRRLLRQAAGRPAPGDQLPHADCAHDLPGRRARGRRGPHLGPPAGVPRDPAEPRRHDEHQPRRYERRLLEFDWGTEMTSPCRRCATGSTACSCPGRPRSPSSFATTPTSTPSCASAWRLPSDAAANDEDTLIRLRWLAEKRIKRDLEGIRRRRRGPGARRHGGGDPGPGRPLQDGRPRTSTRRSSASASPRRT